MIAIIVCLFKQENIYYKNINLQFTKHVKKIVGLKYFTPLHFLLSLKKRKRKKNFITYTVDSDTLL
ncbi:MAG: hypothetical protein TV41_03970 [Wolbachia endosymbiont of Dactylopius coccus]|nr:MAG: hypothetical protein TV41_03970 [Wolbachia endosymbiont of Dactylopius coccus]